MKVRSMGAGRETISMAKQAVPPNTWIWVGLGILITGLFWGAFTWTHGRSNSGSSLLAEGFEAYRNRNYARAAELGKRQLIKSPEDVNALRLLARSTARLGRDAPANALFARLGKSSLEAEDDYLLGVGLNRAGRTDSALQVWQQALAADPGHAETLEQLALAYTRRNRLVEAALLYERLAGQPGWELPGELSLAGLRAELGDPAGAARFLQLALGRESAGSLDPQTHARYRKLLARVWLRTGNASGARHELTGLLEHGTDREAFWLLSRALLQEGALTPASLALERSGSYRSENPLELEPSPYVGESLCAECHRDIFRVHQASRFTTTLLRGKQLLDLPYPDKPTPDPADPAVVHRFQKTDEVVQVETRVNDKVVRAVVDYAFGSPDRYVSLVGHDPSGQSFVLRLSHYQDGPDHGGWVRTTGHTSDAEGGRDFLGKPLDAADGVLKCLFCHTTNAHAVLSKTGPEAGDRAIGCERCHGPGGNHLKAVAARFSDPAIVSPSQGSGEGSLRLCAQCHALHNDPGLPRTDPYWIRFQGTTLPWSRCYTESAAALDCVTCHDPHRNAEHSAAYYEAKCLACHSAASHTGPPSKTGDFKATAIRRGSTCPINATSSCLGCHMPPFRSEPLHATFTDHYIRVRPELKTGDPAREGGGSNGLSPQPRP
jgi:tetratricopeptide (TPR) repeat protein